MRDVRVAALLVRDVHVQEVHERVVELLPVVHVADRVRDEDARLELSASLGCSVAIGEVVEELLAEDAELHLDVVDGRPHASVPQHDAHVIVDVVVVWVLRAVHAQVLVNDAAGAFRPQSSASLHDLDFFVSVVSPLCDGVRLPGGPITEMDAVEADDEEVVLVPLLVRVHRTAWFLFRAVVADRLCVLLACETKSCEEGIFGFEAIRMSLIFCDDVASLDAEFVVCVEDLLLPVAVVERLRLGIVGPLPERHIIALRGLVGALDLCACRAFGPVGRHRDVLRVGHLDRGNGNEDHLGARPRDRVVLLVLENEVDGPFVHASFCERALIEKLEVRLRSGRRRSEIGRGSRRLVTWTP